MKWFWSTLNRRSAVSVWFSWCFLGYIQLLKPWPTVYKACLGSPCWRVLIRIGVQNNFEDIRCTMEHCDGHQHHHHQVEKMGHHSGILKNRMSLQNWQKYKSELYQEVCKKTYSNVYGAFKEYLARTVHNLHVITSFIILHMFGLWVRVATQKPFLMRTNKTSSLVRNIIRSGQPKVELCRQNVERYVWCKKNKAALSPREHQIHAWWWQHHIMRLLLFSWDWVSIQNRGNHGWLALNTSQFWHKASVWQVKMNDPKHKPTFVKKPLLLQKIINVLEWSGQSPELNPIENLLNDLKTAVYSSFAKKNGTQLPNQYV